MPSPGDGRLFDARLLIAVPPVLAVLAVLLWRGEIGGAVLAAAALGFGIAWLVLRLRAKAPDPADRTETRVAGASAAAVAPDPVVVVDSRGVVTEANAAARDWLPALKTRQPLAFALRDPRLLEALPRVTASGEAASVEIGGRVAGEAVHEVWLRPLPDPPAHGEPAVALFFRDLSAERRLEAMRVDFVANVSHELRTPLATLSGFIETLKGPARNDEAARVRFLDIMGAQADRMTRLVNDLLQLSRVELREHVRPSDEVDLTATVAHMLEILAPRARERGASIATELPAEPLVVPGDRDEILRLVENLVENAIRYGGAGAPVEVSLRREQGPSGAHAELAVRDRGPGIAREHLPRLTERFYRADVAESRASGGTGLGLAIVKHIVGRHRGRLVIESEAGKGATFRVTFPLAVDEVALRHATVMQAP